MQRFATLLLAAFAALSTVIAGCSSTRNPPASDAGTGYGDRKTGGGQPSPGTGSGGGGGNTDTPQTRHTISWDGSVLRLRLVGPAFKAWKDGGGEVDIDLDHGWSGQYIPFNATDGRKNGLEMKREGNDLFQFQAATGDKFNVKYRSADGTTVAWHKYETTSLGQGVQLETDSGSSNSRHFLIAQPGII